MLRGLAWEAPLTQATLGVDVNEGKALGSPRRGIAKGGDDSLAGYAH